MRITIVTGPFFSVPPAPCGAVERLWFDLAKRFAAAGHTVTVLARAWPGVPADLVVDGVRVIRRSQYKQPAKVKWAILKDFFYALGMTLRLPAADVTVVNSFWLPVFAPWRKGAGVIYFNVARWPKGQMGLYRHADRLAACSVAVAEEIKRQSPRVSSLVGVLPNPVDLKVFQPPIESRSARTGPRTILYTGRVNPEKGLHLLVGAYAKLVKEFPGLQLRIIGPSAVQDGGGGEPFVASLRTLANGLPIEFLPAIYDRQKLAEALRSADLYCYPTVAAHGESLPVAPLEAMATGLPIVVSDLPQFRDYVTDGVTGLTFDYRTERAADNLAEALRRLLLSPDLCDTIGQAAVQKAQEFSYERIVNLCLADFESLAGK